MRDKTETSFLTAWEEAFDHLHQRLLTYFGRPQTRCRVRRNLLGLLCWAERKNSWQLAEIMHENGPQGMQRLLNSAHWEADAVRDELRTYVIDQLGHPDVVLILDETGFLKKGSYSVGVARQYSTVQYSTVELLVALRTSKLGSFCSAVCIGFGSS